jgi:hypothetical protein
MRKSLFVLAALMLVPIAALAGMTAISDSELQDVEGQTGITISMTMSVTAGSISWEDDDGFGTCTSTGAVILSGMTMPTVSVSSVDIDAGTCSGTSWLAIATGTSNLISGDMTITDLIIGNADTATQYSLGKFVQRGIGISFGTIKIAGH